jgi:hypothetical protein
VISHFRRVALGSAYIPTVLETLEATMVDKDRIQGSAEQAKGKVQNAMGRLKDTLRGK